MIKSFFAATLVTSVLGTGAFATTSATTMPNATKPVVLVTPAAVMSKMPEAKKCSKGFNFMKRKCVTMKKK